MNLDAAFLKVSEPGGGRMSGIEPLRGGANVLPLQEPCTRVESHVTRNTAQKSIQWFWSLSVSDQYEVMSVSFYSVVCCSVAAAVDGCERVFAALLMTMTMTMMMMMMMMLTAITAFTNSQQHYYLLQEHYYYFTNDGQVCLSMDRDRLTRDSWTQCHQPFSMHRGLHLHRHLLIFIQYFTNKYFVLVASHI